MEAGLESRIPTYSGGLGVLSGDTLRAAADLALPMVGVSLVHREGYFRQRLGPGGDQSVGPDAWAPEEALESPPERAEVVLRGRTVHIRAFEYPVRGVGGAIVPVYLLDTRLPENHEEDRGLTDRLYGGDERYRLLQEAVLGFGGLALLRALGHRRIRTFHMNEGHSALVALALLEERVGRRVSPVIRAADVAAVRERCVFTTHTPVPAGHDRFSEALVREVLGDRRARRLGGRGLDEGVLDMTRLALHFSRFVNGVAARHAGVSGEMFPDATIHAITNGVHVPTWTCPPMAALFDRHLDEWRRDSFNLRHAALIPLHELRSARADAKARLAAAVRERSGLELDPAVATLGFARRATPYKRADLLFRDVERLREVARRHGGLQVVFAGKAHPRDGGGLDMIRRVAHAAEALRGDVSVVWLEGYDMDLAGLLTSGVDLWLNNPEKPKEASGTSGMKAALNGVPSLSVLDGWWIEGHVEGATGWSIGGSWRDPSDDLAEAESLYRKLDEVVLPLYRHDPDGYDRVRRGAIFLCGPHFSARRMMHQYVERAYGGST
jgi:starch phosphorylase